MSSSYGDSLRRVVEALRHYVVTSDRVIENAGAARGLNRSDLRTLALSLRHTEMGIPLTAKALAHGLGITSASTTALVNRLAKRGMLERVPSPTDRRSVHVVHTEAAQQTGREIFLPFATATAAALRDFSEEELHVARRVLEAATEAMLREEQAAESENRSAEWADRAGRGGRAEGADRGDQADRAERPDQANLACSDWDSLHSRA